MTSIILRFLTSLFFLSLFFFNVFTQQPNLINSSFINVKNFTSTDITDENYLTANSRYSLRNPALIKNEQKCLTENINASRFAELVSFKQKLQFCETLENILVQLDQNWSPRLREEIDQIWKVFLSQNIKIHPMKSGVSNRILAAAEVFTEKNVGFNGSIYLRFEKLNEKSFFLVFMHELRHIYDFYRLWEDRTGISEAEFEKRGFRVMGKIYQEMPKKDHFFKFPTFWDDSWIKLADAEIDKKREEKIDKWMKKNSFYKDLLKDPNKFQVSFSNQSSIQDVDFNPIEDEEPKSEKGEMLPFKSLTPEMSRIIPQNVAEISFEVERPGSPENPTELLAAAINNEKKLYQKMDNFVYDQDFQLLCWEKQKVTEKLEFSSFVARTNQGELLSKENYPQPIAAGKMKIPKCIRDLSSVKIDSNETFWAAPYLDQMPIKFGGFTEIEGIPVAQYHVDYPTRPKFDQIASLYPHLKLFKTFVGTIYISIKDAQIIKFWGTSFPEVTKTPANNNVVGSYGATAVRQKLSSGIWVTTFLNIVAATIEKDKIKPFSVIVRYKDYRQADSTVKILDDETTLMTVSN